MRICKRCSLLPLHWIDMNSPNREASTKSIQQYSTPFNHLELLLSSSSWVDVKISRLAIACPSTAHVISVLYLTRSLLVDLWNYHGIFINQQSFGRGILLRYRPQTLHVFHTCVHHGHLLCQFSNSVYHSCHTSGEDKQGDKGRRGTAFRGSSEQADTACYSQGGTGTY